MPIFSFFVVHQGQLFRTTALTLERFVSSLCLCLSPPQLPVPTPSLDAATQTFSHTAASRDVSTQLSLQWVGYELLLKNAAPGLSAARAVHPSLAQQGGADGKGWRVQRGALDCDCPFLAPRTPLRQCTHCKVGSRCAERHVTLEHRVCRLQRQSWTEVGRQTKHADVNGVVAASPPRRSRHRVRLAFVCGCPAIQYHGLAGSIRIASGYLGVKEWLSNPRLTVLVPPSTDTRINARRPNGSGVDPEGSEPRGR